MMSTSLDDNGGIHTIFTSPLYTEDFRKWARVYIAVSILEGKGTPHYRHMENAYAHTTGRNPLIL